jgi:hypothetical protein
VKRTLSILVLLLAAFAPALAGQAQGTQPYHDAAAGFTVQLPAAWTRMPQAMVDQLSAGTSARVGEKLPPTAGFQDATGENGALRRLLMVSAVPNPALTEREFVANALSQGAAAEIDRRLDRINEDRGDEPLQAGKVTWDARERIAWMAGEAGAEGQTMRFVQAMRPVERWGLLMLVLIATEDGPTLEDLRAQLLPIARSLSIDGRPSPE